MRVTTPDELLTESDVEQKFIYPLLVGDMPDGLGLQSQQIVTKASIRRFTIKKGREQKLYYPDYIVAVGGYPLVVIEAKAPGEDLAEAYREARLYAAELNAAFPAGVTPVYCIVATNGNELWAGEQDHSEPAIRASFNDLAPYGAALGDLQKFISRQALEDHLQYLAAQARPRNVWKPRSLLGGQYVQDEVMGRNTFGATISADLNHTFNPSNREERARVVKEAYVTSSRRTRYVQPIDSIIRAASPFSHSAAELVEDTERPGAILAKLRADRRTLEHKILLLVGSAGAGKTTFVDYLQEVALPEDLRNQTLWVHLNMNFAPISANEIYGWLRENIISVMSGSLEDVDFEELENLKLLYGVEVNKFNKGRGKLLGLGSEKYNEELARELKGWEADRELTSRAYCRFLGGEKGRLVIIVLDNCDKRLRDEQLLMFEAAQWLQAEYKALVVLPLREETYDHHHNEPPLDTALKDMVFRIEPPPFHEVLSRRVTMARNELRSSEKTYRYELANGMHVDYSAADQGKYLAAIVASIFSDDRTLSRLVLGLSGGNLRRAFEIFLEICNSGHIPESEILKIQKGPADYQIPLYVILRVLLRQNRRFYDGTKTYIRNIFATPVDASPRQYFLQLIILNWLQARSRKKGPNRLMGYFSIRDIREDVLIFGFERRVVLEEVEALAKANCLITEDFKSEGLTEETLVRIAPAGLVHIELLRDVNYWAAMAEDLNFEDRSLAQEVADRMADAEQHYSLLTSWLNATAALTFLEEVRSSVLADSVFLERSQLDVLTDLSSAKDGVEGAANRLGLKAWVAAKDTYPAGTVIDCRVARCQRYGFFVDLDAEISGLVHKSKIPESLKTRAFQRGDEVRVRVIAVEPAKQKVHLELLGLTQ